MHSGKPAVMLLVAFLGGSASADPFSLALDLAQDEVLLGIPVAGTLTLTNTSEQALPVPPLNANEGYVKVYLARPGAAFVPYEDLGSGGAVRETAGGEAEKLGPAQSLEQALSIISPDRRKLALPTAGVYRIVVDVLSEERERLARSPEARVTVVKPEGDDLKVWEKVRGRNYVAAACNFPFDIRSAYFDRVREVLEEYPETAYTPILERALEGEELMRTMEEDTKAWAEEHELTEDEGAEITEQLEGVLEKLKTTYNTAEWGEFVALFSDDSYEREVWKADGDEKKWMVERLEEMKPLGPMEKVELVDPELARHSAFSMVRITYRDHEGATEQRSEWVKAEDGQWKLKTIRLRPEGF